MLTALSRLMKTQGQVLSSFHKYDKALQLAKSCFAVCGNTTCRFLVWGFMFQSDEQYYYLMISSFYSENQCLHVHICIFKFYVMQ